MSNDAQKLQALQESIQDFLKDDLLEITHEYSHPLYRLKRDRVIEFARFLKDQQHFIFLADVFAADRFTEEERFEVIYNAVNLRDQLRIFFKIRCPEQEPRVDSVTGIWPSANWYERETYDMFGILFDGHPDMRRMYMPEGYEYFPLRKEFPLLGVPGSIDLPHSTPDPEE